MRKLTVSIGIAMLCCGMAGTATAATYSFTGGAQQIEDYAWLDADIDVGAISGNVTDINVFVNLSHTGVGDLEIYLGHSVDGVDNWKYVQLFNHEEYYFVLPGSSQGTYIYNSGDNISNVLFDDQAANSISDITSVVPYGPGTFQPTSYPNAGESNLLADFNGDLAAGIWSLSIYDWGGGDTGILLDFRVDITTDAAPQNAVPLPGAVVLLGSGLSALAAIRRARQK